MLSLRSNSLEPYKGKGPEFNIRSYFNGEIRAWGLVQDLRGRANVRFEIDMHGSWEGNVGRLEEHYRYCSGKTEERVWTFNTKNDGSFTGSSDDLVGEAKGQQQGNTNFMQYTIKIPFKGRQIALNCDDWIFQMDSNVLINRSYLKKFGFKVAELTVFMQKVA